MTIHELVQAIGEKHKYNGFRLLDPLTIDEIYSFEKFIGFELPADFRTFYRICNGFETDEDAFRFLPVEEIMEHSTYRKTNMIDFAEYMVFADVWSLKFLSENYYQVVNIIEEEVVLTSSLTEFLQRFLTGNVFDEGGLDSWRDEVRYGK